MLEYVENMLKWKVGLNLVLAIKNFTDHNQITESISTYIYANPYSFRGAHEDCC